jgi:hypothetical protein
MAHHPTCEALACPLRLQRPQMGRGRGHRRTVPSPASPAPPAPYALMALLAERVDANGRPSPGRHRFVTPARSPADAQNSAREERRGVGRIDELCRSRRVEDVPLPRRRSPRVERRVLTWLEQQRPDRLRVWLPRRGRTRAQRLSSLPAARHFRDARARVSPRDRS